MLALCILVSVMTIIVAYPFLDGGGGNVVVTSSNSSTLIKRVLCYGDSLTAGLHRGYAKGIFSPYSRKLQELLGSQYKVG